MDDIEVVDANTGDYVLFNRGDDRLTLTTCHLGTLLGKDSLFQGFLLG